LRAEKKKKRILCLFLLSLLCPLQLAAAEGPDAFSMGKESLGKKFRHGSWDRGAPVDIQSKQMSVDFDARRIIFQGDVSVRQADFSLSAQEVTALFGDRAEDIKKIVAKGDVFIRKSDKLAWGKEAVYDREEATVLLRGNPSLKQGENTLRGEAIRVFLEEDRMDIEGGVKAEFRIVEEP